MEKFIRVLEFSRFKMTHTDITDVKPTQNSTEYPILTEKLTFFIKKYANMRHKNSKNRY